jgi:hypothetical protein
MPRKATHSRYRRPLFILIILLSLFLCVPPRLRRRLARKEPAGRALSSLACLPRAAPVPEGRLVDTLTCFRLASHRSLGTVIVLSSVTWFFGVRNWALLSERDVPYLPNENWAARVSANSSSINDAPAWAYDPNWDGVVGASGRYRAPVRPVLPAVKWLAVGGAALPKIAGGLTPVLLPLPQP